MTALLERAIGRVRALPASEQDDLARVLLRLAGSEDDRVYRLSPDEEADLAAADAEIARGDFATDDEVRRVLGDI